jgi:Ca-activated chloride channel family protein
VALNAPAATAVFALLAMLTPAVAVQKHRPTKKPPARTESSNQQKTKPEIPAQDPADGIPTSDETVRLGTELVNLLFTAVDRNNRILSDIGQQEVTLFEDGRAQKVFTFRRETNLPINIAILMDLSGSQEYTFPQEKLAAGSFLRSIIRPGKDSACILTFQDDVELVQGLSSRLDTLNRAFDEIQYARRFGVSSSRKQATALYDAVYITADEILSREDKSSPRGEDSVTRKACILLTDGVDNASTRRLEDAIERAWRAGVVVYAIGIGDRFRFEGVREDVLRRLSDETGGRAYFPRGPEDLMNDFRQIENEMRSQYLVAYSPSNTNRDGAFRRIEVRLAGRDGVRVIHRPGYYAPLEDVKK